ncbi:phospho-N-acetylmuramoyl-pentapeptide-transferase [Romeria aff. gracilis LEGE 07310]|uniref:Phospho-N-acetylmuramoyl-pentapeptide-transferase n=1 Tax=Vasconcelosia minhoensis LEGE 07310 TaxID=915328 RepID=A0A8J7ABR2_9CYAN|nr:phospho-N-acetylmuramoyl-pentapeptide-transferase [Romeria gracilis]MBE9076724.1 phospho-N-acetylmuramoyl-pentapeptide-transferase [Romeria aff. gracilis LEGE 07310]
MDARFFSTKQAGLSGAGLSSILAVALIAAAVCLDWVAGRSLALLPSLSPGIAMPMITAASISAILGIVALPLLRALKTGQFVRPDGPQAHLIKAGTPTMGGIFFIPAAIAVALLWAGPTPNVLAVSALTLAYAGIGWLDDWQVLRRRSNRGISPKLKLGLQIGLAIAFCSWALLTQPISITTIALPLGLTLTPGLLFWPLAGFVLVAESNATNLTDGVDGLMAGTGAIALLGLAAIVAPVNPDLMIFCAALSGACLGFLVHNRNPAKVFMGDTGSLALGGALAAVGILSGSLFGLLIVTLLFFAETLSVILQVGYYKATKGPDGVGKRLFKMAPIHHHFELSGWTEIQVVSVFYLISAVLVTAAFGLLA